MATRLSRLLDELKPAAGEDGVPRVHWLVTGMLVSGAMWAVLIAVFLAAFGKWLAAGCLLAAAAVLVLLLLLAFRRVGRIDRET